jgi:hypothetical protein
MVVGSARALVVVTNVATKAAAGGKQRSIFSLIFAVGRKVDIIMAANHTRFRN